MCIRDRADTSNYVNIPIIGRVAAGLSCFAETNITDYEPVNKNDVRGDEPFVFLRVVGDSMYPLFMEGDLCLLYTSHLFPPKTRQKSVLFVYMHVRP